MVVVWNSRRTVLNFQSMDRPSIGKQFEAKHSIRFPHWVFERTIPIRNLPHKSKPLAKTVRPMASGWVQWLRICSTFHPFRTIRSEWEIFWPTPMKWNWLTVGFDGPTRSPKMHKVTSTSLHRTFQIRRCSKSALLRNYERNYTDSNPVETKIPWWCFGNDRQFFEMIVFLSITIFLFAWWSNKSLAMKKELSQNACPHRNASKGV